jgi:RecB family endonuclease NucS
VKSREPTVRLTEKLPTRAQRDAAGRSAAAPQPSTRGSSSSSLGRDEVLTLVAEQPELIESGLRVHSDRKGEAVGAGFATDVGEIDLLARDSAGGWVLIVVAEEDSEKELVAELLQLMGWVRKHLGKKGQEVRAIVLLDSVPEDLGYAAAAVADSLEFKRYRLALTFEPVEV